MVGMATKKSYDGFSDVERTAMKERAAELKAQQRSAGRKEADLAAMQAKIAELDPADRELAERVHELITTNAPELAAKLYYGMPGWAKDGKIFCFLQPAKKFDTRYATFGFNDAANLDEGSMWPTSYALTKLTATDEKRLVALVRQALS